METIPDTSLVIVKEATQISAINVETGVMVKLAESIQDLDIERIALL
jgi:hypothetical protein